MKKCEKETFNNVLFPWQCCGESLHSIRQQQNYQQSTNHHLLKCLVDKQLRKEKPSMFVMFDNSDDVDLNLFLKIVPVKQ